MNENGRQRRGRVCGHEEPHTSRVCLLCRQHSCERCPSAPVSGGPERIFTLRLPSDLHAALTLRAKAEDRRLAQIFRAALRAYLDQ
jgi:predicted HicB family RNase H-like nuclease